MTWEPTVFGDTSVNFLAWALFDADKKLVLCGKTPRADVAEIGSYARVGVVEKPWVQQVDPRKRSGRATQKDIQELCIAAGEYGRIFEVRRYEYPHKAPKKIRHERALAALDADERARLPKFRTHLEHIGCAIYMGLRATGRIVA